MAEESRFKDIFLGSVTVGERGQVVIPAEARERLGIQPGEKLLAFIHPTDTGVAFVKVGGLLAYSEVLEQVIAAIRETKEDQSDA